MSTLNLKLEAECCVMAFDISPLKALNAGYTGRHKYAVSQTTVDSHITIPTFTQDWHDPMRTHLRIVLTLRVIHTRVAGSLLAGTRARLSPVRPMFCSGGSDASLGILCHPRIPGLDETEPGEAACAGVVAYMSIPIRKYLRDARWTRSLPFAPVGRNIVNAAYERSRLDAHR